MNRCGKSLFLPLLLFGFIGMHYYLVKVKRISIPFWHKPSGREGPFSEHIKAWLLYGGAIMGVILLVSIFVHRDPGPAPQLLPSSPFYGSEHGPGGLGIVPTFPISWTHGMNRFVAIAFHLEPDIWGTVLGMVLLSGALAVSLIEPASLKPGVQESGPGAIRAGKAAIVDRAVIEAGSSEIGAGKAGAIKLRFENAAVAKIRFLETGMEDPGFGEIGFREPGELKIRVGQVGCGKIGAEQVCIPQICVRQIGPGQVRSTQGTIQERGLPQDRSTQIGFVELQIGKHKARQIRPHTARSMLQPTVVQLKPLLEPCIAVL